MYEHSFHLAQRPFASAPTAAAYVRTGTHQAAIENLVRCIERAEGVGLVVGPAGSGKSLLLQLLAAGFRGKFQVAMLNSAQLCTRKALLQSILFELKLPYREMDEGELRLSLMQHLEPRDGGPLGLLLLIDEAHTLPLRLLEEIRQLTNIVHGGLPRVRVILSGNAVLEERLSSPKLESFQQRLTTRCYLQSLTRDETFQYIREQLQQTGGQAEALFAQSAFEAIFTATDGVPRLINQLCDHALVLAALGEHQQLNAAGIEEAWADLQQLPLPWSEKSLPAAAADMGSIIEFGELNEPGLSTFAPLADQLPDAAANATHLLDQIDDEIAALDLPDGELDRELQGNRYATEFNSLTARGTEIELTFKDPFGQGFDEEEVVIDRYASLEAAALRNRPRVQSAEGHELAVALFGAEEMAAVVPPQVARTESSTLVQSIMVSSEPIEIREDWLCVPEPMAAELPAAEEPAVVELPQRSAAAADPVYPEPAFAEAAPRRATIPLQDLGSDDRDLIIIEEEATPRRKSHVAAGKPKRTDYKQLFSNLRRG